ncbi:flavodoxin family protein [uncultured Megasphaera sp.]|uniref:flavodoxin family protein n=1 Tax=uncultured Megasphaera sp. TaxID=165188 RepID=UPI0025E20664|nr:flavodoxin family protein [uncultured Megasphaera sp.]
MKVLLVNGSPHKEGCTYTALQEVARTLETLGIETEFFWIGAKPIGGCMACHKCRDIGHCVIPDIVKDFREKALTADGFVFGSPVHYAALAGNMTSFMDRVFYAEANGNGNKAFYLKPAAAVISARRAGTTVSFDQMNKYFTEKIIKKEIFCSEQPRRAARNFFVVEIRNMGLLLVERECKEKRDIDICTDIGIYGIMFLVYEGWCLSDLFFD